MALIVEDGTIVANANSYVSDSDLTTYADLRGLNYPALAADREKLLIKAMDFLASQSYQGLRTVSDQELDFPRIGVWIDGFQVASDKIPKELKNAQIELALQANANDLLVNESVKNVQSEKLDVIETSYFKGGKKSKTITARANVWLEKLLYDANSLVRT